MTIPSCIAGSPNKAGVLTLDMLLTASTIKRQYPTRLAGARRAFLCAALLIFTTSYMRGLHAAEPLQMGLFPSYATITLMRHYAPLKTHLEQGLQQNIIMTTAPNLKQHILRAHSAAYDIILTAPHVAKLIESDLGYVRLARVKNPLRAVLVTATHAPYQKPADIKGRSIAFWERYALVSMMGVDLLKKKGLQPGIDVYFKNRPSHTSAALSVAQGNDGAAIIPERAYNTLPADSKKLLRVIAYSQAVPNIMFMAHPRLGLARIEQLRAILLNLDAANSQRLFAATGFSGVQPILDSDMKAMEPFAKSLKEALPIP
jgi:phosphonate transport system substrate-binding protein